MEAICNMGNEAMRERVKGRKWRAAVCFSQVMLVRELPGQPDVAIDRVACAAPRVDLYCTQRDEKRVSFSV